MLDKRGSVGRFSHPSEAKTRAVERLQIAEFVDFCGRLERDGELTQCDKSVNNRGQLCFCLSEMGDERKRKNSMGWSVIPMGLSVFGAAGCHAEAKKKAS